MNPLPEADAAAPLLGLHLARTALGQREITDKQVPLARPARNLLLIIDAKRSAGEWLALVRGASAEDLQQLASAGLVAPADGPEPVRTAAGAAFAGSRPMSSPMVAVAPSSATGLPVATARMSLTEALRSQGYKVLYDRMTAEARPQLGLIKGYKLILDIERCGGPDAIRALAVQFVEQVRAAQGDAKARALAQRLADPP